LKVIKVLSDQTVPPKNFTAQVQVGGRIQIPEPLRIVLDINDGDIVEMTVKKVEPPKIEDKSEDKKKDSG